MIPVDKIVYGKNSLVPDRNTLAYRKGKNKLVKTNRRNYLSRKLFERKTKLFEQKHLQARFASPGCIPTLPHHGLRI